MVIIAAADVLAESPPIVVTDKEDYSPEETVTVFGDGFDLTQFMI